MQKKANGFTIIELVVVIAIIAILSVVVIVGVNGYIKKSKDAALKAEFSSLITYGFTFLEQNGNYDNFCYDVYPDTRGTSTELGRQIEGLSKNIASFNWCFCDVGTFCTANPPDATKWCACAPLNANNNSFCVDSSGVKKEGNFTCSTECSSSGANPGTCL